MIRSRFAWFFKMLAVMAMISAITCETCNNLYVGRSVLRPSLEVPPVTASNGAGVATYLADLQRNILITDLAFAGLSSNATLAHIHRGAVGVNGPILVTLLPVQGGLIHGNSGYSLRVAGILKDSDKRMLLNGSLYINVHSVRFPAGEIRDQVHIFKTQTCIERSLLDQPCYMC